MRKIAVVLLTIAMLNLNSFSVFAASSANSLGTDTNSKSIPQEQVDSEVVSKDIETTDDADLKSVDDLITESMSTESMSTESMSTESMSTESMSTDGITEASNYGLIPNDISKKNNNAKLLNRALNKYGSITLDGTFYIGNTSEGVTNPNIEINGLNGSELIFDNGRSTVLFDPNKIKSLSITNMKFTNLCNGKPLLIVYNGAVKNSSKVDRVIVDGCTFQGDISLYRQQGDTSLNPNKVNFGIDEFTFTNNNVYNTSFSFIVLNDIPFNNVDISNNSVNNFKYVFASMGITNGIKYETEMVAARKYINIVNNKAICDDDWWAQEGDGSYYAFVLTENVEVQYDSNYVEGMKADFDIALYDAYLSSRIVTYTNNTWINNICFDANKLDNTLIKSKQGGIGDKAGDLVPVKRLYANNTFIVEESFAERLGKPKNELFVYFMDLTTYAEDYIIENNHINVYDLRFSVSSRKIKNFVFNDNELKAKYAYGRFAIIQLTDACQPTIEFNRNNIDITQTDAYPSGQTHGLRLVQIVDARTNSNNNLAKSIVVEDNVINAPLTHVFYTPLSDKIVFENNDINVVAKLYSNFVYQGNHPELVNTPVAKY